MIVGSSWVTEGQQGSEVTILVKRRAGEWTASVPRAAGRGGKAVEICELTVKSVSVQPNDC